MPPGPGAVHAYDPDGLDGLTVETTVHARVGRVDPAAPAGLRLSSDSVLKVGT